MQEFAYPFILNLFSILSTFPDIKKLVGTQYPDTDEIISTDGYSKQNNQRNLYYLTKVYSHLINVLSQKSNKTKRPCQGHANRYSVTIYRRSGPANGLNDISLNMMFS